MYLIPEKLKILIIAGKKPENIAEHTCALILSLARKIPQAVTSMKEGKWTRAEPYAEEVPTFFNPLFKCRIFVID